MFTFIYKVLSLNPNTVKLKKKKNPFTLMSAGLGWFEHGSSRFKA